MAVQMATAFIITPLLVHNLGKEQYGIWVLVFSVINYMSFLDFGMKQSLARHLPKYYAVKDYHKLNEVLNSGTFIYSIIAGLTILGSLIVAFFFIDLLQIADNYIPAMRILLIMIGFNQALSFFFMTGTAIGPFHRYDISNSIEILRIIGNTAAIIYFVNQGYGLITLGIITLITNIVNVTTRRIAQQKIVPQLKFGFSFVRKERVHELIGYSVFSFLIVIAYLTLLNADNVIIGAFLSTSSITIYSIANSLIMYLRSLVSSIGVPLAPAISHLDATSNSGDIARLTQKLLRYLYYVTSTVCVGILLFGGDFIYLWMGPGFEQTVKILYILIVPASIYLPQIMSYSVFYGIGKHKILFYIIGAEALCKIILSVIFVRFWGLYGLAIGTIIPQFVIYAFIYPYIFHRMIKADLKKFYVSTLKSIIISVLFTLPIGLAVKYGLSIEHWPDFIINVCIVGAFSMIGVWWLILDQVDKDRILNRIKRKSKNTEIRQ